LRISKEEYDSIRCEDNDRTICYTRITKFLMRNPVSREDLITIIKDISYKSAKVEEVIDIADEFLSSINDLSSTDSLDNSLFYYFKDSDYLTSEYIFTYHIGTIKIELEYYDKRLQ